MIPSSPLQGEEKWYGFYFLVVLSLGILVFCSLWETTENHGIHLFPWPTRRTVVSHTRHLHFCSLLFSTVFPSWSIGREGGGKGRGRECVAYWPRSKNCSKNKREQKWCHLPWDATALLLGCGKTQNLWVFLPFDYFQGKLGTLLRRVLVHANYSFTFQKYSYSLFLILSGNTCAGRMWLLKKKVENI